MQIIRPRGVWLLSGVVASLAVCVSLISCGPVSARDRACSLAFQGTLETDSYSCEQLKQLGYTSLAGTKEDYGAMPPLAWAALGNQATLVREILTKCPSAADWVKQTNTNILKMAMSAGADDAVVELVKAEIGLGMIDEHGATALDYAAMLQKWPVVEELLRHETDLNARNQYGLALGASALAAYRNERELPRRTLVDAVSRGFDLDQPMNADGVKTVRDFLLQNDPGIFEAYPNLAK